MENNEIKTNNQETTTTETTGKRPYRRNNYRRNNNQWREKPKAVSYIKSFDNFDDGFTEVIRFNPELKNYCGDFGSYSAVIASMTKAINDNIPSPNNVNYPNTLSLSIDANEVGFKTDINIAIGWRIRYSYREGKTYYNFRVTFISIPVYKNSTISDMVEAGWKKLEANPMRQNRYWNHLEGKDREKREGFKIRDIIGEQKISTAHAMTMEKAYNEDEYEDSVDNTPEDTNEVQDTGINEEAFEDTDLPMAEDPEHEMEEQAVIDKCFDLAKEAGVETEEVSEDVPLGEPIVGSKEAEEDTAPQLGVDKIFIDGKEVSKEEAAEKMEEALNSSISATASPNVFVIDHEGERRVVNVEEDDIPYGDMLINKETHLISFADGTIFDYKNLNVMH